MECSVRKQGRNNCASVRDRQGRLLIDQGEVKSKWKEYFDNLLNARMQKEADVTGIGIGGVNQGKTAGLYKVQGEMI